MPTLEEENTIFKVNYMVSQSLMQVVFYQEVCHLDALATIFISLYLHCVLKLALGGFGGCLEVLRY